MKLKERLKELGERGYTVKIGGGVGTGSGFFYCGEIFEGLNDLLTEIGRNEEARVEIALDKATTIYNTREERWIRKRLNAESERRIAEERVTTLREEKGEWRRRIERCDRLLNKTVHMLKKKKRNRLQRIRTKWQAQLNEKSAALAFAEKDLHRKESLVRTYATETAKKKQFATWKRSMENYRSEREFCSTPFPELEILEERRGLLAPKERILLIASSITGNYWFREECDNDKAFQWMVRRAKKDG